MKPGKKPKGAFKGLVVTEINQTKVRRERRRFADPKLTLSLTSLTLRLICPCSRLYLGGGVSHPHKSLSPDDFLRDRSTARLTS